MNDRNPLQEFVHDGSQEAFQQIVREHLPLVWSTARRLVEDAHLAEDVAQQVFSLLARKAATLSENVILSGWLYRATVHTASRARRAEQRRLHREEQAVAAIAMNDSSSDSIWSELEPLLDDAMSQLDDLDRDAVVLRFFDKRSLREVGAALGTSDDAAQKRLSRAVEKLRQFFAQKGKAVTAGALIAAIGDGAIQPVPAAVLASITSSVVPVLPVAANLNLIPWTMINPVLATVAIVGLVTTAIVQRSANRSLRAELDAAHTALEAEKEKPAPQPLVEAQRPADDMELLRLRGEVARLRRVAVELEQTKREFASFRQTSVRAAQQAQSQQPAPISIAASNITRTVNNMKQMGLALRMIAHDKIESEFIADGKATPALVKAIGSEITVKKVLENVTLLVNHSAEIDQLVNNDPNRVVGFSTTAMQDDEGRWIRAYLMADGSVTRRQHATAEEIWDAAKF